MANGNRRPLAPVRKLFAGVLGTCALFVILFGAGMQSLAIVALGVALLILAIGLVVVANIRGGARAWVAGTAHVHSVSEPPVSSVFGRCELQVLIDAPGVAGRLVRMRDPRVPVAKWPDVGASLPIMVAIDDPRHIRILWDEVLTHAEAATAPVAGAWERPPPDKGYDDVPADERYDDVPTVEPTTADLSEDLRDLREEDPVVVHQTPGGPIVVEGTLVNPPEAVPPLARRARPDPRATRAERAARTETGGGTATATVPPPRAEAGPEVATPEADAVFDQDAPFEAAAWSGRLFTQPPPREDDDEPIVPADTPSRAYVDDDAFADAGYGASDSPAVAEPDEADDVDQADEAGTTDADGPDEGSAVADGAGDPEAGVAEPAAKAADAAETDLPEDVFADLFTAYPSARPGASGATIHGVGLTFLVTNLERSVAFYRDMLGFLEIDGGEGNAVLASGDTRMVLREIKEVSPVNRRLVHLNLEVGDVMAVYEDLRAKGVRFTYAPRVVNRGTKLELWAAAFRDPDGHGIAITQWRSREAD